MTTPERPLHRTGRGAGLNPEGRFEAAHVEASDDGWGILDEPLPPLHTTVMAEPARSIISRNQSPDVPFEQSINPYRGCEHGCVYCFARPSHSYVNLSPGLDFETKLFYKADAARLLQQELARPGYRCTPIAMGTNTDPYQPIERRYAVTRSILELLARQRHPVTIVTKGALIERDLDLLADMARDNLVWVAVSVTTLNDDLKRRLEPRAASPEARLRVIQRLSERGIPVGVMVAPVIPALTDHELEAILRRAREAGAASAGYLLIRLPHEVKELFRDWLQIHEPLRAGRIMALLQDIRGGRDNDPRFGHRMRGQGVYADLLQQRFRQACRRLGLNREARHAPLQTGLFRPPVLSGAQLALDL